MTIAEARAALKGKPGSLDSYGPAWVRYAKAAEVVVRNALSARPVPVRDSARPLRFHDSASRHHETPEQCVARYARVYDAEVGVAGAQEAGGPVGAKLVQRLPGPVSAYFIAADGDGVACVYRSSDVDDVGDTHQTAIRDAYQRQAAATKHTLKSINARNKLFWEQHQRS